MGNTAVRAHLRGLEVLKALNVHNYSTAQELSDECRLPRPTVYRLLDTLIDAGFVARLSNGERYCLRSSVLQLSSGFDQRARALELARPTLQRLTKETGWPTYLFTYDDRQQVMVAQEVARPSVEAGKPKKAGFVTPLLLSATGRSCLTLMEKTQRDALVANLLAKADFGRYPAVDQARVRTALRDSESLGVGIRDNDMIPQTASFAIPILHHGDPLAFMALQSKRTVVSLMRALHMYLPMFKETVSSIESALARGV